ncbi:MAG: ATPase [Elusimicrobia bacterium]|nr:MAG: ATPase [Elusimicrobiota bacterium]KAF0155713.1 MAG: ATPase [Elusimicrobiota bacterium]
MSPDRFNDHLPEVTPEDLKRLLCLFEAMDNPPALMVYGPPGVGKTTILKEFAEDPRRNYEVRVKHLSRMDTTDWSGLPKQGADQKYTEFLPISLFKKTTRSRLVIFFDELNTAMPQVLNAALDVILEKKADSETFSDAADLGSRTIILAAGNLGPEEDGTQVEELSMAVKTRMVQVRLVTDLKQWLDWARGKKLHPKVISFMDSEEKLVDFNAFRNGEKQAPTPRGWERLSDMLYTLEKLAGVDKKEKRRMVETLAKGTIGARRGVEFFHYYTGDSLTAEDAFYQALSVIKRIADDPSPADAPEVPAGLLRVENGLQKGYQLNQENLAAIVSALRLPAAYLSGLQGKRLDRLAAALLAAGQTEAAEIIKQITAG